MSSARLEVINDDASVAPRMSRAIPAALYGIVDEAAYQVYCDKMDELFDSLDGEYRRRKKRFWWMYGGIYFWFMYFIIFAQLLDLVYNLPALVLCMVHIGAVWICTSRPAGVKADNETMRDIRSECDAMTNRTPFVSFHVVLMPTPAAARGAWLQMNTIDHIAVSISASASATGSASAVSAIMTDDAHDAKVDEVTDNHQPVVFAHAVTNGSYVKIV